MGQAKLKSFVRRGREGKIATKLELRALKKMTSHVCSNIKYIVGDIVVG